MAQHRRHAGTRHPGGHRARPVQTETCRSNMNRKQLILLLLLVLVTGGVAAVVYRHNSTSWGGTAPASGKVLGDFQLNDVARVAIQTGSASVTLVKKNGEWVVAGRDDYPADFTRVGDFIQQL